MMPLIPPQPTPTATTTTSASSSSTAQGSRASAPSIQRSFTLPTKLTNNNNSSNLNSNSNPNVGARRTTTATAAAVEIGASAAIETLYVHPGAKIVSFSTAGSLPRPGSRPGSSSSWVSYDGGGNGASGGAGGGVGGGLGGSGEGGVLAWSNATERTLAAGPLEIYRVPGSVSFLHSGTLLHAILPRSQCWLVDGHSKFAFRVRPDTYYRIELPGSTPEDLELVEGLKKTLGEVLFYERTSCPFRRGDGEVLPEMPEPRRTLSRGDSVRAKKWRFERRWRPEGSAGQEGEEAEEGAVRSRSGSAYGERIPRAEGGDLRLEGWQEQDAEQGASEAPSSHQPSTPQGQPRGMRSVTAPAEICRRTSTPSKSKVPRIAERINEAVKTQEEDAVNALSTPVGRRSVMVDAPTPKLPPTPESLHDGFTEGLLEEDEVERSGSKIPNDGGIEGDLEAESNDNVAEENTLETPRLKSFDAKLQLSDLERPLNEIWAEEKPALVKTRDRVPDCPGEPDSTQPTLHRAQHEAIPSLQPINPTFPQVDTTVSDRTKLQPPSTTHGHSRAPSSDFDYAQDTTTAFLNKGLSPAVSLTASPDPSLDSIDSWASLPPETFRLRRGYSSNTIASVSSVESGDSYHSLPADSSSPSNEDVALKPLQQRSLQPPREKNRPRAPSASQVIAETGALLVRRTARIFLGPPAHLVVLMLRIAARIVAAGSTAVSEHTHYSSYPDHGHGNDNDGKVGMSANTKHHQHEDVEMDDLAAVGMSRIRRDVGISSGRRTANAEGRALGHRRVPGSFDYSDDEEEWGGM